MALVCISSPSCRPLPVFQEILEIGKQSNWVITFHIFPQGPTRRSTTLKSSSSVMRKTGETLMRRELRASELGSSGKQRGLSLFLGSILLKELGCT